MSGVAQFTLFDDNAHRAPGGVIDGGNGYALIAKEWARNTSFAGRRGSSNTGGMKARFQLMLQREV
ncbi:hypothetical protein HHJ39_00025 [Escherichia coli]|nr:hypothetical protein HHJ39_00025 [Escherichia coli]